MTDDGDTPGVKPAAGPAVGVDAAARSDRVGATLRRVFDDAAAEPLPRAFEDLLRKLR